MLKFVKTIPVLVTVTLIAGTVAWSEPLSYLRPQSARERHTEQRASAGLGGVVEGHAIINRAGWGDYLRNCGASLASQQEQPRFLSRDAEVLGLVQPAVMLSRAHARNILYVNKDIRQLYYVSIGMPAIVHRMVEKSRIRSELVRIRRATLEDYGDFQLESGEAPFPRVVQYALRQPYTVYLDIPWEFERDLNVLRTNNLYMPVDTREGARYAGLAEGVTYYLFHHELVWHGKRGGHIMGRAEDRFPEVSTSDEKEAYAFGLHRRYTLYNEAVMLWYVFSFSQDPSLWLDNEQFRSLLRDVTAEHASEINPLVRAFRTYFPNLAADPVRCGLAKQIAAWINFEYFIRPARRYVEYRNGSYSVDMPALCEMLYQRARTDAGPVLAGLIGIDALAPEPIVRDVIDRTEPGMKKLELRASGAGAANPDFSFVDQTNRADSNRRLALIMREIKDRVRTRAGVPLTGPAAVVETRWLLGRLSEESNCSDALFSQNMPLHMKEMDDIVHRLVENPSTEVIIAAMLHDADRFFDGYYVMIKDEPAVDSDMYRNYYKPIQHPAMAAEFVRPLLKELGVDEVLIAKIDTLIRNHETGIIGAAPAIGSFTEKERPALIRDSNILMDADAISMFTPFFLANVLKELGPAQFRNAVYQKYKRVSISSRRVIDRLMEERLGEYRMTANGRISYGVFIQVREEVRLQELEKQFAVTLQEI